MKTRLICLMLALWTSTAFAQGQDKGVIRGQVTNAAGQPLPGANVLVKGPALPKATGAAADAEGRYQVGDLPSAAYEIVVSHVGYRTWVRKGVWVEAGTPVEINFSLAPEAVLQDKIVVSASRKQEKILNAPASVIVTEAAEIQHRATALNVTEHVRSVSAVDLAQTGLAQNNTVVRGFNNVFSGALLSLVDNRIAHVPSLRLNAQNFIPLTDDDIERIEVVLGPGSALYGPNSANGVMHVITRSPFGSEGTTVSVGGGERSLRTVSLRHAGTLNKKVGYKISGQYYAGTDWKYVDPEEVRAQGGNPRNYGLERKTAEVRLDFRPTESLTGIVSAGYTEADNIEMTGLGAAQADAWKYGFLQARLRYKALFTQVFYNRSDAGATRLLRSGNSVVDKSSLTVYQVQHSAGPGERQRFTYGLDALLTRPNTGGTINGANEDKDDINEYGFYLQSESALSERLDLVLAGRLDDHNHISNPVASPRAALMLKPAPTHTVRLTYNRAFSTPTSNNLFLDLVSSPDAFGLGRGFQPALGFSPRIDVRAQGGLNGFTFRRDAGGLPMFRSPFAPVAGLPANQYIPLHDPLFTNVMWGVGRGAVLSGFLPTFRQLAAGVIAQRLITRGTPPDQAQAQARQQAEALAAQFERAVPRALPGLRNAMGVLNLQTRGFDPIPDPARGVTDIPKPRPTITRTFEIGYKGVVRNRLLIALDLYQTTTEDFVGPLRVETPSVFLDAGTLSPPLSSAFGRALQDTSAAQLSEVLAALDAPQRGGNGNGTPVDELTRLFVAGAASNGAAFIPFGTVSPQQAYDPAAVVLAYRNFGEVKVYGLDLGLTCYPNDAWTLSGNYSYVSKNLFKNLDGIGDIALNAPRHKFNLGATYKPPRTGLRLEGRIRYRGPFPMNSGVYVGDVRSYTAFDLDLAYDLPLRPSKASVTLTLSASNLFNDKHQEFVGAPEIGRLVSGGLTVRL